MEKKYFMHKINNLVVVKKIVTIHYQELPEQYCFQGESHNFWEIAYADKNNLSYIIDNKEINLNEGEIIFIKPNSFHSLKCKKNCNLLIVSFECNSTCMDYFSNKKFCINKAEIEFLSQIINEAKQTFFVPKFEPNLRKLELLNNPNLGGEQMIKNYLEILLISLLRNETNKPYPEISFFTKVDNSSEIENIIIKMLKNNIYNKISLEDIAHETHYSKTYLCTTFKQTMSTSIINYYIKLKIEEAKTLIIRGYSFSQISELLKFDSLSHFTHTFIKYNNMTPTQYKKSISKERFI